MVKEMYPCVLLRSCHMLNSCTAFPVREVSNTTGTGFANKTTLGPEKNWSLQRVGLNIETKILQNEDVLDRQQNDVITKPVLIFTGLNMRT